MISWVLFDFYTYLTFIFEATHPQTSMAINLSLPPLSSDTVYKATFFVAFVGCVLTFLGLAIAQSGLTGSITANPLGVGWYLGFLQWAILAYSVYAYRNSSLNANKLAIVGLIAAYAGPFPTQLGGFIITNQSSFAQGNLATGCGFLAAGFILTIFPFLAILLMLGTADDMKFGLIDRHQSTGTNAMHNNTATLHNNTAQNSNTQNSNSHKETVVQINSTPAQTVVAEYACTHYLTQMLQTRRIRTKYPLTRDRSWLSLMPRASGGRSRYPPSQLVYKTRRH